MEVTMNLVNIFEEYEEKKICYSCCHFHQHYVLRKIRKDEVECSACNGGHCSVNRRVRQREALEKGCKYWEKRDWAWFDIM